MKVNFILLLVLSCLWMPLAGQWSDDFSDGELSGWEGDTPNFTVNSSLQLQLNAPSGSTHSWLHVPVPFADSMTWEMYIRMDFAPSTSNQLKIFLGVDSPDLANATGYYLEIGATGDQDALELKYLNAGTEEFIAGSTPGLVADQPVDLVLRVTRDTDGTWKIFRLGQPNPELLFSATQASISLPSLQHFGFSCQYTETRRDKFFFDDIRIYPPQPDITPPQWITLQVQDPNTIQLIFDEPLDESIASMASHYHLSPGNAEPDLVTAINNDVILFWNTPFTSQQAYTLTVADIRDLAGNSLPSDTRPFTFLLIEKASANQLLITEIMADPTPVIGLPDAEYLELYNATGKIFRLSDYSLLIGTGERTLPDSIVLPGEYLILCDPDYMDALSPFGRVIPVASMPALTNGGTLVGLRDQGGVMIHSLTYSTAWYHDPGKVNGGWSLEMMNPGFICFDEENWSASVNLTGGTPGKINSQWSVIPDDQGPAFSSFYLPSPMMLELHFREKVDPLLMINPSAYTVQPPLGIQEAALADPYTVLLTFAQPLQEGVIYHLLPFDAYDCLGNLKTASDTLQFGLIVDAAPGDVLINEVLFNPATGGSRYLEIINPSNKFINLSTLAIARLTGTSQDIYSAGIEEVLAPGGLAVFTPDREDILSRYTVPEPWHLYQTTLPSWDDQRDNVSLLVSGMVVDSFTYSADWHHPVIADQNGVSLERVSSAFGTAQSSNWHSASSLRGYGTPTGPNSQLLDDPMEEETPFTLINRLFSPNDDGDKDYLAIEFNAASLPEIASVRIYDLEGRDIREIISNESLGNGALVQWDGRNKDGTLSDMGMYIVYVELWNELGVVKAYQASCALVKR